MRVCLLNDSFPPVIDGVANTVLNYASVLSGTAGWGAMVATPKYPGADYTGYPFPVEAYTSFSLGKIVEGYRAGNPLDLNVINRIREYGPDVLHTHCPVISAMLARILRKETDAPVVFTYHTKFDEDIAKALSQEWARKETTKVLVSNISACDEVWTVSSGAGENLKSLGYEGDYKVVFNGVDFPKGKVPEKEMRELLKDYPIAEGVPVFLYVGRMMTYKGLPLLIDALGILNRQGMDFQMVFVGGGVDTEELKEQCRDAGIEGKVLFTGPIYERRVLQAWNTRADLFMFPSTYDTNGIVVREAAACGLAALLIEESCAAEGITDGVNGFTAPENPEGYAEKLKQICEQEGCMKRVGDRAMDEIYISWEDSVRHARSLYEDLVDRKLSGRLEKHPFVPTEAAVAKAAEADRVIWKMIRSPKRLLDGMLENIGSLERLGARRKKKDEMEFRDETGNETD